MGTRALSGFRIHAFEDCITASCALSQQGSQICFPHHLGFKLRIEIGFEKRMTILLVPQSLLPKPNEQSCQETVSIQEQKAADLPGTACWHTAQTLLRAAAGDSLLLTALTRIVFKSTKQFYLYLYN